MISNWPCPLSDGRTSDELLVTHGTGGEKRILIIPPLFGEHNAMRRQLIEVMRRLADSRSETLLPDLPGWNESVEPLQHQTLAHWRDAIRVIAQTLQVSAVLAVRSGALLVPAELSAWLYAPQPGEQVLRTMVRARIIASREAGFEETSEAVCTEGRTTGVTLGGWQIGPELFGELENADVAANPAHIIIDQAMIGGPALWLRAEPDEDAAQADALATTILEDMAVPG